MKLPLRNIVFRNVAAALCLSIQALTFADIPDLTVNGHTINWNTDNAYMQVLNSGNRAIRANELPNYAN